jgi:uncharacterized membrane protein
MRTRITSTILIIAVAMAFFFRPSTSAYANSQNGVRTFPLEEDFESGNFPPTDWNVYDVDGLGMIWESSNFQNHTPGGSFSAYHGFASGAHDGWMVTPALEMPADPPIVLAFWHYTVDPAYYGKNSVAISTGSGDPADGDFVEIWSAESVDDEWQQVLLSLEAYTGQMVYIAFRYEGDYAHGWAIDDVYIGSDFNTSPQIFVTPETLNATVPANATVNKNLTVANAGVEELIYSIEISYNGGSMGWLFVEPMQGNIGSSANLIHTVSFDPAGMELGEYSASLQISSNDPDNPEISIPVNFTIIEASNVEVNIMLPSLTFPVDISESGEYVAIAAFGGGSGYLWSKTNGLISIGGEEPSLNAVAEDGVVAGTARNPEYNIMGSNVYMSGYWHPQTGEWTFLPLNPEVGAPTSGDYNSAWGMSADGSVIVGMQYYENFQYTAYRWTEAGGFDMIGNAHTGGNRPNGVSNDGSVVYGWADFPNASRSPVIWYNDEFITIAPDQFGEAFGASSNGEYVTGVAGENGFIWNPSQGTTFFENSLNNENLSPIAISDDGTIFGYTAGWPPFPDNRNAFVRLLSGEMMSFNEYAQSRGMADAADWTFYSINGVTPDGSKVIGSGINPDGEAVSFMIDFGAEIPNIVVAPESLEAYLFGGDISTQELTVENTGNGPLSYEMFINYLPQEKRLAPLTVPVGETPASSNIALQSKKTFGNRPDTQLQRSNFVLNYDGDNMDAIGLISGGTFYTAVRFPAEMLVPFAGADIESVDVYINDMPAAAQMIIWGAGTTTSPGDILLEQNVVVDPEAWNNIALDIPLSISNEDIWIGFNYTHDAGLIVAGIDGGPANPNGGFISQDAQTWEKLTDVGFNSNWNIRANVQLGEGEWLSLDPQAGEIPAESEQIVEVTFQADGATAVNNSANIIILSNDPQTPMLYVPVELELVVGIEEETTASTKVYPVPASGFINIQSAEGIEAVRLTNSFGQIVTQKSFNGSSSASLDLQGIAAGYYTLQITGNNGTIQHQTIIVSK